MNRRNLPRTFDELGGLRSRGLIRESTEEQGGNSGPIVQERELRAFAERYGLLVPDRLYSDFRSGSDALKRPEFLSMVADAKSGEFDVLLVYDQSRYARNWRQAGRFEDELHTAGVVVAYILDNTLSTTRGQVVVALKHALNEDWLDVHREKVRNGYRVHRFEKGKFSGTVPLGYVMEYEPVFNPTKRMDEPRDTGRLIPDTEPVPRIGFGDTYTRANLARLIGELYATGQYGTRALATYLNRNGYRTRDGRPFCGDSIRHIVESPTYAGYLAWHYRASSQLRGDGAQIVPGSHEPLWSEDLWKQIQASRERLFRGSAGGRAKYPYPFRHLAVCDRCGSRLYGEAHKTQRYMVCRTQRERHDCDQRAVRNADLERQIGEWFTGLQIPSDWRATLAQMQRGMAHTERPTVDRSKIAGQLERLNDLYVMDSIDREEYVTRKRALDATLTSCG